MPNRYHRLGTLLCVVWLVAGAAAAIAQEFASLSTRVVWDDLFAGTRSESMGQADLALARGPMAFLVTPAVLPTGRAVEAGYGKLDYVLGLGLHQYGLAAELDQVRFGVVRMDLRSDDQLVRTAYNPEGTGTSFKVDERLIVVAASVDVAGLLVPESDWQWTIGAGYRDFRFATGDEAMHAGGVDLGTSARYRRALAGADLSVGVAGVIHNVDNSEFVPRDARLGLAVGLVIGADQQAHALALTVGYVAEDDREIDDYFTKSYLGFEATLGQILSFRLGRDRQLFGGSNQYGFGLTVPSRWTQPFGLTVDWGSMGLGDVRIFDEGSRDMISVTVTREL